MVSVIDNLRVCAMASAVSSKWDSLRELSNEDPEVVEKFIKKIGVTGRYSASIRQTTVDFCYAAAEAVLNAKGIDRKDVGVLVFVSQTPDYRLPASACVLAHYLGLSENLIAFDINLGCSGFVYGLDVVCSLMNNTSAKYGLMLAGDTSAREFSPLEVTKTDHAAAMLFGDSGTATLVERKEGEKLTFLLNSDGDGYQAIINPYGAWRNPIIPKGRGHVSQMDDIAVFNFATDKVPTQINEYMEAEGTTPADYDCLVLHQANLMIMKRITKKTGFPPEKMLLSMDRFGNTSSSSIPISLVNEYGDTDEEGTVRALCSGFGVGLSWGTVGLTLEKKEILPLVHTDEYFEDGMYITDPEALSGKNG